MSFNTINAAFVGRRCSHGIAGMINARLCPPETRYCLPFGSYHLAGLGQSHFVSRIRRMWRDTFRSIVSSCNLAARRLSRNGRRALTSLGGLIRSVVDACSVSVSSWAWLGRLWMQSSSRLTVEDLDEVLELILGLEHDVQESEADRLELRARYIEDVATEGTAFEVEMQVTIETLENATSGTSLVNDVAELDDVFRAIVDMERNIKMAESVRVELHAKYVEGCQRHAALEAALDVEGQVAIVPCETLSPFEFHDWLETWVAEPSAGYEAQTGQGCCCGKIGILVADEAIDVGEMDAGERGIATDMHVQDEDVVHSRIYDLEDLTRYWKELGETKTTIDELMLEWDTAIDGWEDDERTLVDISSHLAHAASSKPGFACPILDVQHSVVAAPDDLLEGDWMSGDEPSFDRNDFRCSDPVPEVWALALRK